MPRRQATGKRKTVKQSSSPSGRLRIVAGIWRSRVLEIADLPGLRPTSERVRETLFNWLAPTIKGARCLDLFAGTGALGLEALSRGASEVVFVENSKTAATVLRRNVDGLDARGASVQQEDAYGFLSNFCGDAFDVIFLDPPFASDSVNELCRLLADADLLATDGKLYFEQDRRQPSPELPDSWHKIREKVAGNVRYALVSARNDEL